VAGNGQTCTLGELILSAGSVASGAPANGQLLLISQITALFSQLRILYGGDGVITFAALDLRAAAPNALRTRSVIRGSFQASVEKPHVLGRNFQST
jgi:microcystin-dependent protein